MLVRDAGDMTDGPLTGFVVGITADRRWAEQADLLRRRGAQIMHGPSIATCFGGDDEALRAVTVELIVRPPDYLAATTGVGVQAWMEAAAGWNLSEPLTAALGQARIVARGPKSAAAVEAAGLGVWASAANEQTDEVIAILAGEDLSSGGCPVLRRRVDPTRCPRLCRTPLARKVLPPPRRVERTARRPHHLAAGREYPSGYDQPVAVARQGRDTPARPAPVAGPPVPTKTPHPSGGTLLGTLGASELLHLQRLVGNQAVVRLLEGSPPAERGVRVERAAPPFVLRRDYLDQMDKTVAFTGATKDMEVESKAIGSVLEAIGLYEKLNRGYSSAGELIDAVNEIYGRATAAYSKAGSGLTKVLLQLIKEATIVQVDLATANMLSTRAEQGDWGDDSDEIANALAELRCRQGKYDPKLGARGKSPQQGIYAVFADAIGVVNKKGTKRSTLLGDAEYKYGDPKTGKISDEIKDYLDDFEQIRLFLATKSLVLFHLLPLAKAISDGEDKLASLKGELRKREKEEGFAPPQIPLGILPSDVFVNLLREGAVLDDFGAGLQHGELSHRIQWYALTGYIGARGDYKWKHSAFDLFKRINTPPFSPDRTSNTMWGTLLDKGTSASSLSYSAPGTLNRDLLESTKEFEPVGPGLAERDSKYIMPDTTGLEPIGEALLELRSLRILQAAKATKRPESGTEEGEEISEKDPLNESTWKQYGVPPTELATEIEGALGESTHKVALEGEFNDSAIFSSSPAKKNIWKVLKEN